MPQSPCVALGTGVRNADEEDTFWQDEQDIQDGRREKSESVLDCAHLTILFILFILSSLP
jgi:hypothetical protein